MKAHPNNLDGRTPDSPGAPSLGPVIFQSDGPSDTEALGQAIGANAQPGHLVLLVGGLGAGKTCLVRGALRGLGSTDADADADTDQVRSPTFVLVMVHAARVPLYHADLYRLPEASDQSAVGPPRLSKLAKLAELDTVGLDEYVHGDGLCMVEWADRAPGAFPTERLHIRIEEVEGREDGRTLTMTAVGRRHADLLGAVTAALGSLRGDGRP